MHIKDYKLDNMCATLEISKRTYYKYRNAQDKDYYDYLLIKEIFDESIYRHKGEEGVAFGRAGK